MSKLTWSPLVSRSSHSLTGADPAGRFPRFAAVSPTFGRLLEGTDLATAGQTPPHRHFQFTAVTTVTDFGRLAEKSRAMLPNGWPVSPKPVSFCKCRFRVGRPRTSHTQRSEGAWSVPDPSRRGSHQISVQKLTPSDNEARRCPIPTLWITMWTGRHRFHLSTLDR